MKEKLKESNSCLFRREGKGRQRKGREGGREMGVLPSNRFIFEELNPLQKLFI